MIAQDFIAVMVWATPLTVVVIFKLGDIVAALNRIADQLEKMRRGR